MDDGDYFQGTLKIEILANQKQAPVYYKIDDGNEVLYNSKEGIVISSNCKITAWSSGDGYYSDEVIANYVKSEIDMGSSKKLSSGIYKYSDIKYAENECCTFNLYTPEKITYISQSKPAVVYIHGGSWNSGDADDYEAYFESGNQYFESYVKKYGIPVLSINYRLIGESDKQLMAHAQYTVGNSEPNEEHVGLGYNLYSDNGNRIIDILDDVRSFFSFVKDNKDELKVDDRFCILDGYSAGANIALLYCLSSQKKPIEIKALIDRVGPANIASKEYVNFFSQMLVHSTYTPKISGITVTIDMQSGENDGERFLESMVLASSGLNKSFGEIDQIVNDSSLIPDEIKEISPFFCVPDDKSKLPYVVMIYGADCSLDISVALSGFTPIPEAKVTGDFLAPRIEGEKLALLLDESSLIQTDVSGRIVKNKSVGNSSSKFAYYPADLSKGQKIAFIGSESGGHGMNAASSQGVDKQWAADELLAVKEAVAYAVQDVCGIQVFDNF